MLRAGSLRYHRAVRKLPILTLLLSAAACGGSSTTSRTPGDGQPNVVAVTDAMGTPHPGDAAPDFELVDQVGAKTKLSSMHGSIVVLAFVTSWCPFSRAEQPYLKEFADEYAPKGVKFVAVDIKEPEPDYRSYLGRVAMPFPVLRDESGDVAMSYVPPRAFPDFTERYKVVVTSNLVIDRDGVIRFFALADSRNFDARFTHARKAVDAILSGAGPAATKT
jgi:peroxiredoxin